MVPRTSLNMASNGNRGERGKGEIDFSLSEQPESGHCDAPDGLSFSGDSQENRAT